jgi:hypothetical protein
MTSTGRAARFWPGRSSPDERDTGAAMMVAVLVMAVVAVLCTTTAVLATRSIRSAGDAQTAGVVKDLANAGLAEGVTYLRQTGATPAIDAGSNSFPSSSTGCVTHSVDLTAPDWTRASAARIDGGAQGTYAVWIEKVSAAATGQPATYRICSEGLSGQGKRVVSVVASYTPAGGGSGPYAVYGKGELTLQSSAQVISNMSAYSEKCIDRKANKQTIGGTDLTTGLPAAAHAMEWVLDGPGPDDCQAGNSVHNGSDSVDADFPYDTDRSGGPVGGDADAAGRPALSSAPWNGSTLEPVGQTPDQFRAKWGLPDMLGATSITALETTARQQGNYYYLTSSNTSAVATPDESHAVVFLDFQNHETINLAAPAMTFLDGWGTCVTGRSLIIVVRNADVEGNGNRTLRATLVIKNGGFTKLNGGFSLIGGMFGDDGLDLSGDGTVGLDACAINNPPPGGTPQVDVSDYVEYDR